MALRLIIIPKMKLISCIEKLSFFGCLYWNYSAIRNIIV